jgi:hypothetical protein
MDGAVVVITLNLSAFRNCRVDALTVHGREPACHCWCRNACRESTARKVVVASVASKATTIVLFL